MLRSLDWRTVWWISELPGGAANPLLVILSFFIWGPVRTNSAVAADLTQVTSKTSKPTMTENWMCTTLILKMKQSEIILICMEIPNNGYTRLRSKFDWLSKTQSRVLQTDSLILRNVSRQLSAFTCPFYVPMSSCIISIIHWSLDVFFRSIIQVLTYQLSSSMPAYFK